MKLRSVFKIATISSIILLCIGCVVFFYFRMTEVRKTDNFDLYTVVPSTAIAIVDSDNMVDLLTLINELDCNKHNNLYNISLLLSQLKDHINTLLAETPHGFSRQMNKTLISFHEPYNNKNQVYYCRLGVGDRDIVKKFIKKYCESSFPSKYFDYKGEEITIYSMPDDNFLACYINSDFFAVSYQKKLIEQVIDSKLSGESILDDPGFIHKPVVARNQHPATVQLKMEPLNWGNNNTQIDLDGTWTEFGLKLNNDMIYLAGVNHAQDSTAIFMNALKKQKPVENFPGNMLPASTFYLSSHSISDINSAFSIPEEQDHDGDPSTFATEKKNNQLITFLDDYSINSATTCMFDSGDSLYNQPCIVANIPILTPDRAERYFHYIARTNGVYYSSLGYYHNISMIPERTILSQLIETNNTFNFSYVCFYNGSMLVAPDTKSIIAYIEQIDNGDTLEGNLMYEEARSNLSNSYNFLLIADLERTKKHFTEYIKWIPDFIIRNHNTFENFILTSQFTCVDSIVYPNIVLLYKGDSVSYMVPEHNHVGLNN